MNFVFIAGHLGADPETRFTPSGQKVTTLRLAAKARKSGAELTIWWRVTVWGDQFDKFISFLKKGSAVIAVGTMNKPEVYNDREGKPQVSMEMTASNLMFPPFGKSGSGATAQQTSGASAENTDFAGFTPGEAEMASPGHLDDEVPF